MARYLPLPPDLLPPMDATASLLHKAQRYLRSAAVLLEIGDHDSTVSRAYFSMFYAAQALLLHHEVRLAPGQGMRAAFIEQFVDTGLLPERAGVALEDGYVLMEAADFGHLTRVTTPQAERMLAEAEAFVNSVTPLALGV